MATSLIGDQAFEQRESFDFNRAGKPGECMQVVGALRKSVHWRASDHDYSGAHELLPVNFPLVSSTSCFPRGQFQEQMTGQIA